VLYKEMGADRVGDEQVTPTSDQGGAEEEKMPLKA
jgi:hypothetical protein